jgi:hypothetical protein
LEYFMAIWNILLPFGIFYSHLVYFPRFVKLHQEKSGNHVSVTLYGMPKRRRF